METQTDFEGERKRLTHWAWGVTGGYGVVLLVLSAFVVFGEEGVDAFRKMAPNEVGDLLAGVAGPVAFIWLVYGYFLQGIAIKQQADELSQNTRALHLQEEALRAQVEELKNSVAHQHEIALATSTQTRAILDAAKPQFSVRIGSWDSTTLIASIYNSGGPASNLIVAGCFGEKHIKHSFSFLPKEEGINVAFEEILRPSFLEIFQKKQISYYLALEFEYGNGLRGIEFFDFVEDETTPRGRFVNRKIVESSKDNP